MSLLRDLFDPCPKLCRLLIVVSAILASGCGGRSTPYNVVLVTIDTTRADHIGCYGNDEASTPVIDGLAAEGVLFKAAVSTAGITCPSHSTILTGRYPMGHGVRDNGQFILPDAETTLAEVLSANGWATAAAVGGFPLVAKYNLNQGFDFYDDHLTGRYEDLMGRPVRRPRGLFFDERKAARVNEALYPWIDDNHERPFFIWAHYYDPHRPWEPPAPYDQLFGADSYLGEIAYADESLGVLLRRLETLGVIDRTLVVVVSDHGEGLDEHGETTHSMLAFDTTLHVPLVIRPPGGQAPRVVEERVATADLVPTILDLVGIEPPAGVHGRSLRPLFEPGGALPPTRHYAEAMSPRLSRGWGELRTLYEDRWKLIWGPRPRLYDIEADPKELDNLAEHEPEKVAELKGRLQEVMTTLTSATAADAAAGVDAETMQKLEALGYLQAGTEDSAATITEVLVKGGIAPEDRVHDINLVSAVRSQLHDGRPHQAIELVRQLLAEAPADTFYLELLAQGLAQTGQIDEALATIDDLLASGAGSGTAEQLLVAVGQRQFAAGQRDEGLRRVRQSIEARPTAQSYHALSIMLAAEEQFVEAQQALEQALELEADYPPVQIDLAVRKAQNGDRDGAESIFRQLLIDNPYFAQGHYNYGAFLSANPELDADVVDRAIASFERAIELNEGYTAAYLAAISGRLATGHRDKAEELLGRLEQRAPDAPGTQQARALLAEGETS